MIFLPPKSLFPKWCRDVTKKGDYNSKVVEISSEFMTCPFEKRSSKLHNRASLNGDQSIEAFHGSA